MLLLLLLRCPGVLGKNREIRYMSAVRSVAVGLAKAPGRGGDARRSPGSREWLSGASVNHASSLTLTLQNSPRGTSSFIDLF